MSEIKGEGSRDITKIKTLILQVLFSTAGISAFLYVCGMLAVRSKMNMLGIWTDVDLNSCDYINESIRIFLNLPIILGCLSASAVPVILIIYLAGLFGYSFSWNRNKHIPLKYCSLFLLLISIMTIIFAQPMGNQNLLFRNIAKTNLFLPLVVSCNAGTWAFYSVQILVSVFIFFLALRLWLTNDPQRDNVYGYLKGITTLLFFINFILVPVNYGVMISSKEYREAIVLLTKKGIVDGDSIQGTLLLQTDRELVLLSENLKKEQQSLFVIRRANIGGIRIIDALDPLLTEIWNDELKKNKEKVHTVIPMDTNLLFQLSPTLVDYLSTLGNEITTILNNFQKIVKGGRVAENIPDRSGLNIWIYDIDGERFRQITTDGDYFSPRVSSDGQRICFIKDSKLWEMTIDGREKTLIDQQRPYNRITGWDGKSQYLLIGKERKLYLLDRQQKDLQEIILGIEKFKKITVDAFIKISQTASSGKMIYAARKERDSGSWRLIEDHDDYVIAKVVLDDGYINLSPSWLNDENRIIFVSNRKKIQKQGL